MPTYTVTNSNFRLKNKQKEEIAKGITKIHNLVTGANKYFAQVIFNKTNDGNHFMGGKKVKDPQIFLHGQIRAGRSNKIKKKLIIDLRNILIKKTKLDQAQVWVYIIDLLPSQMIEYGEVLPKSGKETEWFNNLSSKLRSKLSVLDS
tara:strand:- start:409 stop:849 length:441 start_codon:yes stop_codon:yes gene_type:complete